MFSLLPGFLLFIGCIYGFVREIRLDSTRHWERERNNDAHVLQEIERFLREQRETTF